MTVAPYQEGNSLGPDSGRAIRAYESETIQRSSARSSSRVV
jgi:hypothetical protein